MVRRPATLPSCDLTDRLQPGAVIGAEGAQHLQPAMQRGDELPILAGAVFFRLAKLRGPFPHTSGPSFLRAGQRSLPGWRDHRMPVPWLPVQCSASRKTCRKAEYGLQAIVPAQVLLQCRNNLRHFGSFLMFS